VYASGRSNELISEGCSDRRKEVARIGWGVVCLFGLETIESWTAGGQYVGRAGEVEYAAGCVADGIRMQGGTRGRGTASVRKEREEV